MEGGLEGVAEDQGPAKCAGSFWKVNLEVRAKRAESTFPRLLLGPTSHLHTSPCIEGILALKRFHRQPQPRWTSSRQPFPDAPTLTPG